MKLINSKSKFIDKSNLYILPLILIFLTLILLVLIKYTGVGSFAEEPLFARNKLLMVLGFNLGISGIMSEQSSVLSFDIYQQGDNEILFNHHSFVSIIKISLMFSGIFLFTLGAFMTPENHEINTSWPYYILYGLGAIFTIAIIIQLILAIKRLVSNRKDYLYLSQEKIQWFDNDISTTKTIKIDEILGYSKKYESDEESPEIIEILIHLKSNDTLTISLKDMSLMSQHSVILEELVKLIPEKTL